MELFPGTFVRHPTEERLGPGRVQSVEGSKVVVNFINAGKVVIDSDRVNLIVIDDTEFETGG